MKIENKIPFKRILQQLKADLIGKDSYRGVTLTYALLKSSRPNLKARAWRCQRSNC